MVLTLSKFCVGDENFVCILNKVLSVINSNGVITIIVNKKKNRVLRLPQMEDRESIVAEIVD